MVPNPIAVGLSLCDYVIVEERTKKVSLIGAFTVFKGNNFPYRPYPFCVYAGLTDGLGVGTGELTITRIETDAELYTAQVRMTFPNRLSESRALFRIAQFVFPAPGDYLFTLSVDGKWACDRHVKVHTTEEIP